MRLFYFKKQMMEMIYDKLINEIRLINWLNASNSWAHGSLGQMTGSIDRGIGTSQLTRQLSIDRPSIDQAQPYFQ